ncbi:DUF1016 N-terminal domain-containing protein [Billgrantia campisalis]|uniref:DUF1016 N-terminal domain-containing protein n=1 Tax=Billgrantia campisalis TaxID=74661 RepID=UPI003BEEB669
MSDKAVTDPALVTELSELIDGARQRAAVSVNAELTLLYWRIGHRINRELLKEQRASYGEQVMAKLAKELTKLYGRGWSKRNLANMCQFAQCYPKLEIVQALSAKLHRSAVLQPQTQATGGHRPQARALQSRVQGPDGALPALAGSP